ncbi:MAG: hypothetical protein CBC13_05225 [Planctomycetia bacterium TMED53]|nr:MAG: hypothetical protein CBC13_05225 [Planctomycetia bacterium TMED53]
MITLLLTVAILTFVVDDPKPVTPNPDKATPPLPYVTDADLTWRWVHAGAPVGTTRTRLSRLQRAAEDSWRLDSRMLWNREGRALDLRQNTDFEASGLRPIALTRQLEVNAALGGISALTTAAKFRKEDVRIVVRNPNTESQVDRVIPLRENFVLLGNQSFEHWLLIAMHLKKHHQEGKDEATFSALIPGEYRYLDLKCRREREEQISDLAVQRWHITSKDFEARLWVGPQGEVERYRQGEVEIQRIRSSVNRDR